MNDFDITLDIMEKDAMGEEYKWRLQTRIAEDTYEAVLEFANKFTRGNISAAVRYMIGHHIEKYGNVYVSPVQYAWLKVQEQQRIVKSRLEKIRSVHLAAIELKRNPNPNYEQAVETLANELGITWPVPDGELPVESSIDPDLRYITHKLDALWETNGRATTLRELQRKANKYTADELRGLLGKLESENQVILGMGKRDDSVTILPPM